MGKKEIINLLYTIYVAGFNHGVNEGPFPENGTFDSFNRLIKGESPTLDGCSYSIKEKIEKLISQHLEIKNGDSVKFNEGSTVVHHNISVDETSVYSSDGKLLFDKEGTIKVNQ